MKQSPSVDTIDSGVAVDAYDVREEPSIDHEQDQFWEEPEWKATQIVDDSFDESRYQGVFVEENQHTAEHLHPAHMQEHLMHNQHGYDGHVQSPLRWNAVDEDLSTTNIHDHVEELEEDSLQHAHSGVDNDSSLSLNDPVGTRMDLFDPSMPHPVHSVATEVVPSPIQVTTDAPSTDVVSSLKDQMDQLREMMVAVLQRVTLQEGKIEELARARIPREEKEMLEQATMTDAQRAAMELVEPTLRHAKRVSFANPPAKSAPLSPALANSRENLPSSTFNVSQQLWLLQKQFRETEGILRNVQSTHP